MHDAAEPNGPAQQPPSNAIANTVNVFCAYSLSPALASESFNNGSQLYYGNTIKKDFCVGTMVASPTFNVLGQSAEASDNYNFQTNCQKPCQLSPSKEFSLVEQHDELSLTKDAADCPSSALYPNDSSDVSPGKIRREISFHSKSSDLFGERQRAQNNDEEEERRTRQVSSITEQTNVCSTQHSDD